MYANKLRWTMNHWCREKVILKTTKKPVKFNSAFVVIIWIIINNLRSVLLIYSGNLNVMLLTLFLWNKILQYFNIISNMICILFVIYRNTLNNYSHFEFLLIFQYNCATTLLYYGTLGWISLSTQSPKYLICTASRNSIGLYRF